MHLDFTGSSPQAAGPDQLLHQREPGPDVLRHLHDHRGRPADPLERRLLPAGRRHHPGRLVLEAEAPGRAERAATTASAGSSTCSAGCSGRPTRRCSTPPASPRRRTSCTPATTPTGDRKGEWFQLYSIGFGGIPGRPLGDGPDGHSLWPSFVNIPCEFLESYYPLRIEKWETVADTGGAGLHRGGNGVDVAYRFLEPGTIAIHDDRWLDLPVGRQRRRSPARAARKWIERADGSREVLPSKCHDVPVAPGDVLHFVTWGGGGWGDPLERDPELVALEVRRGLVSADGARRYGVVRRRRRRARRRGDRGAARPRCAADRAGELPVFDMGPPIEELLARCEEETGLPAPEAPGLGRMTGPHGAAFGGRVGLGRPAGRAGLVDLMRGVLHRRRPARPRLDRRPVGGGDRGCWSTRPGRRRAGDLHTVVRYRAGAPTAACSSARCRAGAASPTTPPGGCGS